MFWRMLWFTLVLTISPVVATAQVVCDSAQLDTALAQLGDTCADLPRNTACYGNNALTATFVPQTAPVPFAEPADQIALASLETLTTAAYNPDLNEWGIAVMNIQANLPDTLPGQGVIMLAVGGMEVTNNSPDTMPMAVFTFRSGIGRGACEEAPSFIAIRSPQNIGAQMNMNGLSFQLGSTLFLLHNQDGTYTAILTEGTMLLTDGTTLVGGQALDMVVDPTILYVTSYSAPRPATPEELALASQIEPLLTAVTSQETTYTVQPGDNLFRIALNNGTCVSAIARANNIPASAVRNIGVGRVLVIPDGTSCGPLVNDIPGAAPAPPPQGNTTPNETDTTPVDCSGFGLVSPLSGLAYQSQTFYWNGVAGASYYDLKLAQNGGLIASTAVQAPATNATLDYSTVERSVEPYVWSVTAYGADGAVLCAATSPGLLREFGDPNNDDDQDGGYGTYLPDDSITVRYVNENAQRRGTLMGVSLMFMMGSVLAFGTRGKRQGA
jgi:LysM repeat protein